VDTEKYNGKKFPEYAGLLCGISHSTLNEKRNPIKQNLKKKKDTSQNKNKTSTWEEFGTVCRVKVDVWVNFHLFWCHFDKCDSFTECFLPPPLSSSSILS
jgi:hypothetical protein